MTPEAKKLKEQLLALPKGDRLELVTALLASVESAGEEISQADWERLWLSEVERRWREIADGKAETRAAQDVLREARTRLS